MSRKISLIVALLVTILGVGLFLENGVLSRASNDAPHDVEVSTVSCNAATIVWKTDKEAQGLILYSQSIDGPWDKTSDSVPVSVEDAPKKDHSQDLTLLRGGKTYYFKILIGDTIYDNKGVAYTLTTTQTDASGNCPEGTPAPPQPSPIQHLEIPGNSSGTDTQPQAPPSCTETDCNKIPSLYGKGCSTQDWVKCIQSKGTSPSKTP